MQRKLRRPHASGRKLLPDCRIMGVISNHSGASPSRHLTAENAEFTSKTGTVPCRTPHFVVNAGVSWLQSGAKRALSTAQERIGAAAYGIFGKATESHLHRFRSREVTGGPGKADYRPG